MSRCPHRFSESTPGKKLDPGGRCALEEGHTGKHRSEQAIKNVKAAESRPERKRQKARSNRANAWKRKDHCPSCGGMKMIRAKHCHNCRKATRSSDPSKHRGGQSVDHLNI